MGDPATVVVVVVDVGDTAKPLSLSSSWRLSTWVVDDDVAMVIDLGRRRRGDGGGRPGSSSWVIDVAMAVVDVVVGHRRGHGGGRRRRGSSTWSWRWST